MINKINLTTMSFSQYSEEPYGTSKMISLFTSNRFITLRHNISTWPNLTQNTLLPIFRDTTKAARRSIPQDDYTSFSAEYKAARLPNGPLQHNESLQSLKTNLVL